eukprot:5770548-Amphidinium_carterae.1
MDVDFLWKGKGTGGKGGKGGKGKGKGKNKGKKERGGKGKVTDKGKPQKETGKGEIICWTCGGRGLQSQACPSKPRKVNEVANPDETRTFED